MRCFGKDDFGGSNARGKRGGGGEPRGLGNKVSKVDDSYDDCSRPPFLLKSVILPTTSRACVTRATSATF